MSHCLPTTRRMSFRHLTPLRTLLCILAPQRALSCHFPVLLKMSFHIPAQLRSSAENIILPTSSAVNTVLSASSTGEIVIPPLCSARGITLPWDPGKEVTPPPVTSSSVLCLHLCPTGKSGHFGQCQPQNSGSLINQLPMCPRPPISLWFSVHIMDLLLQCVLLGCSLFVYMATCVCVFFLCLTSFLALLFVCSLLCSYISVSILFTTRYFFLFCFCYSICWSPEPGLFWPWLSFMYWICLPDSLNKLSKYCTWIHASHSTPVYDNIHITNICVFLSEIKMWSYRVK